MSLIVWVVWIYRQDTQLTIVFNLVIWRQASVCPSIHPKPRLLGITPAIWCTRERIYLHKICLLFDSEISSNSLQKFVWSEEKVWNIILTSYRTGTLVNINKYFIRALRTKCNEISIFYCFSESFQLRYYCSLSDTIIIEWKLD